MSSAGCSCETTDSGADTVDDPFYEKLTAGMRRLRCRTEIFMPKIAKDPKPLEAYFFSSGFLAIFPLAECPLAADVQFQLPGQCSKKSIVLRTKIKSAKSWCIFIMHRERTFSFFYILFVVEFWDYKDYSK